MIRRRISKLTAEAECLVFRRTTLDLAARREELAIALQKLSLIDRLIARGKRWPDR